MELEPLNIGRPTTLSPLYRIDYQPPTPIARVKRGDTVGVRCSLRKRLDFGSQLTMRIEGNAKLTQMLSQFRDPGVQARGAGEEVDARIAQVPQNSMGIKG